MNRMLLSAFAAAIGLFGITPGVALAQITIGGARIDDLD